MPVFVCIDCSTEFLWDESPSEERCAQCLATVAAYYGEPFPVDVQDGAA